MNIEIARDRPAPLAVGFAWGLAAAVAFGITTPLIARFGARLGPWSIASLLYAGAACFALPLARDVAGAVRVPRRAALLGAQAVFGAMLAPAALAYGLQRAGALGASLALTMEVPLSIALAALVFREHVSRRVATACTAILTGALLLAWPNAHGTTASSIGIAFVIGATALWALDNALSSLLTDVAFGTTVFVKAVTGALLAGLAAIALHEPHANAFGVAGLGIVGALGYGASLWCYLRAQRTFGIARTASVFAIAPFVGASLAIALGERIVHPTTIAAFLVIAFGAYLHASERHAHTHVHDRIEHEHYHVHDDDHHSHVHAENVTGAHVHPHGHDPIAHVHEHASDPDHLHSH